MVHRGLTWWNPEPTLYTDPSVPLEHLNKGDIRVKLDPCLDRSVLLSETYLRLLVPFPYGLESSVDLTALNAVAIQSILGPNALVELSYR